MPSPSPRRICRLLIADGSGSQGSSDRKSTCSPSPSARRTVALTAGTDCGNMEAGYTGCGENAGETRTVNLDGPLAEKKPQRAPKVGKNKCPICGETVAILKRHVEAKQLSWYFTLELACWQCRFAEEMTMKLWGRHGPCSNELFDNRRLCTWSASMWGWISLAARFLEVGDASALVVKVRREHCYPKAKGFLFSPTCQELLRTAQKLHISLDVEVSAQPSDCKPTLLTWQTAIHLPIDFQIQIQIQTNFTAIFIMHFTISTKDS